MAQPPPGEIAVGTVVADTYEVTRLIGMGGMGAVWAAMHRRLPGKQVAIKVLLGASTDPEALARFRREAEIASRIGHPNIIEVLDFHSTPSGTPYMILEFLDGESLAGRLRRVGPLSVPQALEIVRQVGSALHAAHRADVVHRDLKPDNIFLCPTDSGGVLGDRVKVLDFGISKIRGSSTGNIQTQEATLLGTPQYMSPEQAHGKNKSIDQRTDVWALGTIVYELITGEPAFCGESLVQVILRIVSEPAPSLKGKPGIPDAVAAAVEHALQKDVALRCPDVATFIQELTGRPLQTLDRKPSQGVVSAVDAYGSTSANVPTPVGPTPGGPTLAAHASTEAARVQSATPSLATQPRGEVVAVPPTHRIARAGSRSGLYAGVALALVGLGAAVLFGVMRKPQEAHLPEPGPGQIFAAAQPPPAPAVAAAPPAQAPPPVAAVSPPTAPAGATQVTKPVAAKPAARVLPPEVTNDLDAAEQALAKGDTAGALHLARRTLGVQKSGRAFAIITRAYCREGDLGNAKASFLSVAGSERVGVVKACRKLDIDLP